MPKQRDTTDTEAADPTEPPQIRGATIADAAHIWRLVRDCGVLDLNSCYAYLLMCRDFAATTLVAVDAGRLAGFVIAYIPPTRPEAVFVWQIGAAPPARGQGLGKSLLLALLQSPACREVRFLEATITPSNQPSRRLFRSLAETLQAEFRVSAGFAAEDFRRNDDDFDPHEPEELVRIGPITEQP